MIEPAKRETFIQVFIFGKSLKQLNDDGVELQSTLSSIGCGNSHIIEVPILNQSFDSGMDISMDSLEDYASFDCTPPKVINCSTPIIPENLPKINTLPEISRIFTVLEASEYIGDVESIDVEGNSTLLLSNEDEVGFIESLSTYHNSFALELTAPSKCSDRCHNDAIDSERFPSNEVAQTVFCSNQVSNPERSMEEAEQKPGIEKKKKRHHVTRRRTCTNVPETVVEVQSKSKSAITKFADLCEESEENLRNESASTQTQQKSLDLEKVKEDVMGPRKLRSSRFSMAAETPAGAPEKPASVLTIVNEAQESLENNDESSYSPEEQEPATTEENRLKPDKIETSFCLKNLRSPLKNNACAHPNSANISVENYDERKVFGKIENTEHSSVSSDLSDAKAAHQSSRRQKSAPAVFENATLMESPVETCAEFSENQHSFPTCFEEVLSHPHQPSDQKFEIFQNTSNYSFEGFEGISMDEDVDYQLQGNDTINDLLGVAKNFARDLNVLSVPDVYACVDNFPEKLENRDAASVEGNLLDLDSSQNRKVAPMFLFDPEKLSRDRFASPNCDCLHDPSNFDGESSQRPTKTPRWRSIGTSEQIRIPMKMEFRRPVRRPRRRLSEKEKNNKKGGGKSRDDKIFVISCKFPNCKAQYNWKVRHGKLRLLDHAMSHYNDNNLVCQICQINMKTTRQMRYHYKKIHSQQKASGYGLKDLPVTGEGLQKVWTQCFGHREKLLGPVDQSGLSRKRMKRSYSFSNVSTRPRRIVGGTQMARAKGGARGVLEPPFITRYNSCQ
ncbi:unnamed protein product [Caenorhabditis auriculariae]|uniref:C2H2-type domain-containing protein n=1 Tax=Caenorhabditis auriculariae TaxID=2777116 RepID=A0A8S1GXR8_9PELO|nr:unnamed protein product [Caenorhabditis auriculariae]